MSALGADSSARFASGPRRSPGRALRQISAAMRRASPLLQGETVLGWRLHDIHINARLRDDRCFRARRITENSGRYTLGAGSARAGRISFSLLRRAPQILSMPTRLRSAFFFLAVSGVQTERWVMPSARRRSKATWDNSRARSGDVAVRTPAFISIPRTKASSSLFSMMPLLRSNSSTLACTMRLAAEFAFTLVSAIASARSVERTDVAGEIECA